MSTHGLVLGKFYPPHASHHNLIDTALAQADRVTVLALAASHESIPVDRRVAWLRERHPGARIVGGIDDHPIDLDDPAVWEAHMAVFRSLCPEPVDLVFTDEDYGDELADRFGARHVRVDRAFAVTATAVRADPPAQRRSLQPQVRAWLTRRIAVVGAESTGTTKLARALAARYATAWVPEYGRAHTQQLAAAGTPVERIAWSDEQFAQIALRQQADEDRAARRAGPVLVCDTDALATAIWQERYLGRSSAAVAAIAAARRYSLYVLTADDIAFEQDGLRDGEHLRGWMTQRFRERLAGRPEPWIEVAGSHERRLASAAASIDALLRRGWGLAAPLG